MVALASRTHAEPMYTLHIEHPITDYATWKQAFDRFEAVRATAGVRAHIIGRPVDDDHHIVIDLTFDTDDAAGAFLQTLRTRVWADRAASPGLAGDPVTRIVRTDEQRVLEFD